MKYKMLIEQAQKLVKQAEGLLAEYEGKELPAEKLAEFDGLMTQADELKSRAERVRQLEERDAELKTLGAYSSASSAGASGNGDSGGAEDKTFGAVYAMKFGDESSEQKSIMADLVGNDYRQQLAEQHAAFAKYLRWGEKMLELREVKLLLKQIFPWSQVEYLLKAGMSIAEVKTTMVEAQGTLGGYAVPPSMQAAIVSRLPGRSVVRSGGATVIELTAGNSVEVPIYTGGDSRYRGAVRGEWGNETKTPTAKNATLGMTPVIAQVYTYKVGFSQSLVEDAANLISLVQDDISDTLLIDEDEAFLIGDGTNKPLGVLPSSANGNSLSTVNSGHASALTADGIIGLSDGIDEQYMDRARFVFNKATGTAIRKLKSGSGEYLFDRDVANNIRTLAGYPFARSEAMPDVAGSAFPIIFGDFSGYWIVQKAGMTIMRMQDSNTGINKVEYHVRRRIGGRVVKPWTFCLQYVSA